MDTDILLIDVDAIASTPESESAVNVRALKARNASKVSSPGDTEHEHEHDGPQKTKKRRASRACLSCRARKVRCNVVEGIPCTNCRWDMYECRVVRRRRKKTLPINNPRPDDMTVSQQCTPAVTRSPTNPVALERHHFGIVQTIPVPLAPANQATAHQTPAVKISHLEARVAPVESRSGSTLLPPFIRPLPPSITIEDATYLQKRGALIIPKVPLQRDLLLAFVQYVYPYMPVVDLAEFFDTVGSPNGQKGQVSLLLFHAVMFAGTAFADMKWLREAGYATRTEARRAFFWKARLLYDFDYESDRFILIQSLLLMSYWYESSDYQKDASHWIGVAASLARTIGLDHNLPPIAKTSKEKTWKRVWWSCFMRDCLISVGMRRPRKMLSDFNVPMLVESDFDIQEAPEDNPGILPASTLLRDAELAQKLAALCVAKARLCLCISHILDTQYSVQPRLTTVERDTTQSTMMLFPNQVPDVEKAKVADMELVQWVETLPACCQCQSVSTTELSPHEAVVTLHRSLLHMIYSNAMSTLHRPLMLSRTFSAQHRDHRMSQLRVYEAAAQVSRLGAELHRLGLDIYLPAPGVTTMMPAMLVHLLELKSPVQQTRERAALMYRQCASVLERLRDVHIAAEFAYAVVDTAAKRAGMGLSNSDLQAELIPGPDRHAGTQTQPQMLLTEMASGGRNELDHSPSIGVHASLRVPGAELPTTTTDSEVAGDLFSILGPTDLEIGRVELGSEQFSINPARLMTGATYDATVEWEATNILEGNDIYRWLQFPPSELGAGDLDWVS